MTHKKYFELKVFGREREGGVMGSPKMLAFLGMIQKALPRKHLKSVLKNPSLK